MASKGKWLSNNGLLYLKNKFDAVFAKKTDIPTNVSQLTNDSKYINKSALEPLASKSELPTNVSQLANDARYQNAENVEQLITSKGYQTSQQVEALVTSKGYQNSGDVQGLINNAVSGFTSIDFQIVQALPETGKKGTIYLLSNGGGGSNSYDEYIYINSIWEKIGTTDIDLSSYYNTENFTPITNAEIDTIFN